MRKISYILTFFFAFFLFTVSASASHTISFTFGPSLIPHHNSTYTLGTTTKAWLNLYTDEICLAGSCRTSWPSGGGGGSGNVSTSTAETHGFLAYWTSTAATPALLGKVATSSVTISSPLTSSGTQGAVVGGSSWAIGCQSASGSQAGCLSSADWTTFNNKESTLTFTSPLIRNSNTITYSGLATTTQPSSSNLLVSNGGAGVYGVGTSTANCTTGVSCTSFSIVGAGDTTITSTLGTSIDISDETNLAASFPITLTGDTLSFSGLSTTTTWTQGNLVFASGANQNQVATVATGTVSAGSSAITVTSNRSVIGGALSIDCATASGSQNGCLSSTDWTTFNNKQASLAYVPWGGSIATTYASSTIASTTPAWFKTALYASSTVASPSIIDALTTINGTTTNLSVTGNIQFNGVTASTWAAFCTAITGGSGLCDGNDATGGGGGSGSVSTSTNEVANQVAVFTSNSATPATIGGDTDFTFSGNLLTVTQASSTIFSVFQNAYFGGTATTTFTTDGTFTVGSTVGTSTINGSLQIGATAGDNALKIDCSDRVYPASITVGGCANISMGTVNTGAGLVVDSNAAHTGRLAVFSTRNSSATGEAIFASSTAANTSAVGVIGAPTGKGIIKVTHSGVGTGFSNSSALSIDLLACTDCQGIFLDRTGGAGTGNLLNLKDNGTARLTLAPGGLLTVGPATTTDISVSNSTHFSYLTNSLLSTDTNGKLVATTSVGWNFITGGPAGANPTASIGLSATNGSATTFMRSDAAPALSQAIAPTWSQLHIFQAGLISQASSTFTGATTTIRGDLVINGDNSYMRIATPGGIPYFGQTTFDNLQSGGYNNGPLTATFYNLSSTTCAKAGIVVAGNNASPTQGNFGVISQNATTYTGSGCAQSGPEPYSALSIFEHSGPMVFLTGTTTNLSNNYFGWLTQTLGANAGERMRLDAFGLLGIGTTSANRLLTISSSTKPQLALTDGSLTNDQWTFRSIANSLFIATSTFSATSTRAALAIDSNSGITLGKPLSSLLSTDSTGLVGATTTIGWNLLKGTASSIFAFDSSGNPTATTSIGYNFITGGPAGANPTASVGLSAVNGSATTFMRSDGAPALDQSIAPTMTGAWAFTNAASTTFAKGLYANSIAAAYIMATSSSQASIISGKLGIASTSPSFPLSVIGQTYASATSTVGGLNVLASSVGTSTAYIYSTTAGFGGRIILEDSDAAGCTEIYALNGTLISATVTCPTEL